MARAQMVPELDPRQFPIDLILHQSVDADGERSSPAWTLPGTMARNHRPEAGVFPLGLMGVHRDDLRCMRSRDASFSGQNRDPSGI